jgi:methylglutaconyl-CoA hydratase
MIRVKVTAPTGTIILDRADRCNALNREMVEQLRQALDDLRQEKRVRGIVLTGAGPHFCAGLDLYQLHETISEPDSLNQWFNDANGLKELYEEMLQLPKPIVAAVDGAALGSGLGLVLASDLVIASQRATFSSPAARHGLVSGKNLGIVHHVVTADHIWVRASNWVDSIAKGAPESVQLSKKILNETIGEQLFTWLASGAAAMATSLTTEAAGEGLAAYVQKRPPQFP